MPNSRQPLQSTPAANSPLPSLRHGGGQLFETERRLNAVLNNASVSIFLMDDRQHCIYMNRAAEALTGWTLDEVLARNCPLHDIVHHTYPDGRPFPLEECAIDRAFPENNQERGEEVFVHRDGHFFPVGFTASPIRDDAANIIGTIIEVRDISEEKAASERQRLLINELNHRVKNTLATVQAIVGSTARTATDIDSFYEAFVGRIKSLAHTHSVLTEATWQTASLNGLLVNELRPYAEVAEAGGEDGRVVLQGPPLDLPSDIAVPVGMAIHELTTNAAKYGALSNRSGRVTVAWELEPVGPAGTLRLTWRETGGPPVSPPRRQGFGSRLLHRVLITQVQAEVTTDYAPDGFSLTMRAPLPTRNASLNPLA